MRLFLVIKNRKGMTLIELIVVLVIIAIISAVAIPSFSGYIEKAKAHECEVNREILKDNLLTLATLYPDVTGEGYLNGNYPLLGDVAEIKCPSGGIYTYQDGAFVCSVHGSTAVGLADGESNTVKSTKPQYALGGNCNDSIAKLVDNKGYRPVNRDIFIAAVLKYTGTTKLTPVSTWLKLSLKD